MSPYRIAPSFENIEFARMSRSVERGAGRKAPMFHWITPTAAQLKDGSAVHLEAEVGESMDLIKLLRARAESDADLQAGPLFGMLVLTDTPLPRQALVDYLSTIGDRDASKAAHLRSRIEMTSKSLAPYPEIDRDAFWFGVVDLVRRTLRPLF